MWTFKPSATVEKVQKLFGGYFTQIRRTYSKYIIHSYSDIIYNEALTEVEDQVITISGKYLSDSGRSSLVRIGEVSSDLIQKLNYDIASQKLIKWRPFHF